MKLFKRIFGRRPSPSESDSPPVGRGKYMPDIEPPADELFVRKFIANGGKFLYCENREELLFNTNRILTENRWKQLLCYDMELMEQLLPADYTIPEKYSDQPVFLTTCEYLVSNTGAILICSNQIKSYKLHELPSSFIVFAKMSQLVPELSEGIQGINRHYKKDIPTNITTLQNFKQKYEEDTELFLNHKSNSKNLYLLLLEDL